MVSFGAGYVFSVGKQFFTFSTWLRITFCTSFAYVARIETTDHHIFPLKSKKKTTNRDDFLWLWKMEKKHRILLHTRPMHVTSNFFFRSFLIVTEKMPLKNLPVLSTIGSDHCFEVQIVHVARVFPSFPCCTFFSFISSPTSDSCSFTKSKIHCTSQRTGDLRIVCGFSRKKAAWKRVVMKISLSFARLPISTVRFWLFNI